MVNAEGTKKEYADILQKLTDPGLISDWQKFEELSRKKAHLEKIIIKLDELQDLENQIEENKEIIKAREDPALVTLAETELKEFQEKAKNLAAELDSASLAPSERENVNAVIIEIRAGTGGEEAAIFAADLFRMYSKYADNQGWKQKILDSKPTSLGGFKETIFELKNGNVFSKMQYEGGVHRVQRIPATEKSGRVHTSTASVAVLPKPQKSQMKIKPADLKIEVSKATGPGGQNVNKRMTAVRIVHLPSGLAVDSHTERNLQQNKENAMAILEAKLHKLKETQELEKLGEKRKAQIKGAQRADKIRTYNFPQDRVTDHRITKSFHNIEGIMSGNLNPIIEAIDKLKE